MESIIFLTLEIGYFDWKVIKFGWAGDSLLMRHHL